MSLDGETEPLEDEVRDEKSFALIYDLAKKNASRYERQARSLLKQKILEVYVESIGIKYQITLTGCWSITSRNLKGYSSKNWTRMGWRRSSKMKALPMFFAVSEANVLLDLSE